MCMFISMCVFVCTHMITYIHLVWLQTLENYFVSFHPVQKLLQVLHTSPTVTLYTNMHSTMLSHHVWLKGVECKLIKQCAVFCTNTSISFLYIQKVQPSSIEHRAEVHKFEQTLSVAQLTHIIYYSLESKCKRIGQYHTTVPCIYLQVIILLCNTVQCHMTSHYIIHIYL